MRDLKITVRNLINNAFKSAGIIGSDEEPTGGEQQDALILLNEIISGMNNESLFFNGTKEHSLVPNNSTEYYLENISVQAVNKVLYKDSTSVSEVKKTDLTEILNKLQGNPSIGYCPSWYNIQYDFPISVLRFDVPFTKGEIVLLVNERIEYFDDVDQIVYMPDGWIKCLRANLAYYLCQEFEKEPSELLVNNAVNSKALLKTTTIGKKTRVIKNGYMLGSSYYKNIIRGD